MIKRLQNSSALLKDKWEIASCEDAIKINSIVHQLSASIFTPMIKYAWFVAKLIEERSIFKNVNNICFPLSLFKKHCACKDVLFIKCSWCEQTLSFVCFYDKYHPNNCNPESVDSENK